MVSVCLFLHARFARAVCAALILVRIAAIGRNPLFVSVWSGLKGMGETAESIIPMLRAIQNADADTRNNAEKHLKQAAEQSPSQLMQALTAVTAERSAPAELRQEASVLLRSHAIGLGDRASLWETLDDATKEGVKLSLLNTVVGEARFCDACSVCFSLKVLKSWFV